MKKRLALVALAAVALSASIVLPSRLADLIVPPAQAAGFTWTGAVSSDWFTPGNWSQ